MNTGAPDPPNTAITADAGAGAGEDAPGSTDLRRSLSSPVVLIALVILLSVVGLIGSAIFGYDKGVLASMARTEYARGLITYLFAVVTIGTAVVLVVFALTGSADTGQEHRFERGKEVLSLLLGIFGTIVGFYFGSELGKSQQGEVGIRLAPIRFTPTPAANRILATSFVSGGRAPYRYGFALGTTPSSQDDAVPADGWVVKELELPGALPPASTVPVSVEVRDSEGRVARQMAVIVGGATGSPPQPADPTLKK